MSSIEATIARIQNPSLSREQSFDLYLDYLNDKHGHEKGFYYGILGKTADPTANSFNENLTAFRGWFGQESEQFQEVMDHDSWDPAQIARRIQRSDSEYDFINSGITHHLHIVGRSYYENIVASDPFPEVTLHKGGCNLQGLHESISVSGKARGYFYTKLAVELHHRILHPHRNPDAPCDCQLRDAWKIGNYAAFLRFVEAECLAPYMGVFDPA